MRAFKLVRNADVSGVSGTGVVAEGVVWSDGEVTLRWLGQHPTTEDLQSIGDVLYIHGHGGSTEIKYEGE